MKTGEAYWNSRQQRAFDLLVVGAAQPALWVARPALRFSIRDSGYGPVFYQQRIGSGDGEDRMFEIEKLQTLDCNGSPLSSLAALYRRFGIDELAQLANVRRGEMSFGGPRPLVHKPIEGSPAISYEEVMDNVSPTQQVRWDYVVRNRPAGIASSHGIYQHIDPDCDQYEARVEMDIQDGMEASPLADLRLLAQYITLAIERRL